MFRTPRAAFLLSLLLAALPRCSHGSRLVRRARKLLEFCEARPVAPAPAPYDGPAAGRDLQPYFILSRQHSGSTWLSAVLGDQPCVVCGDEKFHEPRSSEPRAFGTAAARRRALEAAFATFGLRDRDADAGAFYASRAARPRDKFGSWVSRHNATLRRGGHAFGFKWMFTQGVVDDLREWLFDFSLEHGVKLVWLRRRNLFKQYLSSHLAAPNDGGGRVALDVPALLALLADHEAEDAAIEEALTCLDARGVRAKAVAYEDLVVAGSRPVVDFLLENVRHRHGACRAPAVEPHAARHVRNHTRHPSEYVANWEEVQGALAATPWRAMPEEP